MIEAILQPEIFLVNQVCSEEAAHLIKQLEVAKLATDKFIKAEINFDDFLELMKLSGVNIDEYLLVVEENLLSIGIKV